MANQPLRFIHCADLHLDSPYKGLFNLPDKIFSDIKNSTFIAYERLIDLAIEEQVDFVLFVGDLFDQHSASLKSTVRLKKGLQRLNEHHINAYISYGNHDYGIGQKADLSFPPNTHVFKSEKVSKFVYSKNDVEVASIYGFSYEQREVKDSKVGEYQIEDNTLTNIATLHGSLESNHEHATYAPFLLESLRKQNFDYWALGHIHKREILSENPPVVYPGNIQGRHIKETDEKGCYLVEMNNNESNLYFHSLQEILFQEIALDGSSVEESDELLKLIESLKEDIRNQNGKTIVRLNLMISNVLAQNLSSNDREELHQLANESEEDETTWVWLKDIKFSEHIEYDRNQLKQSKQFIGEVITTIDEQVSIKSYVDDLMKNGVFKKMDWLDEEREQQIMYEAEQFLMQELLKDGSDDK
ncbi:DNA repair exonuclease [Halalkalibacillus sediminis]|uniref:DNA repair exonuclease n=1 Tax=Halalkalibacillus sediminis TaxID=2018042 RepID=A0A2I0QVC8_9BACI|nr:DNA repair exonuclease [Halalkalibacillus sediminis]PKR78264.1 DNA repair exonuclease [Halalkalibacillus sediminis]